MRATAAEALGLIPPGVEKQSVVAALKKAAQDEDAYVRRYADPALKSVLAPTASPAPPATQGEANSAHRK